MKLVAEPEPEVDNVLILMATFNGAAFISAQIQSLINQNFKNWQLIIRDDGSTDNTLEIINSFRELDMRITLIRDDMGNLRSCQNFSTLMDFVNSEHKYIMFCDQDDVWKPEKIEVSLKRIKDLEIEHSADRPLMVYGTYVMIDERGEELLLPVPDFSTVPTLGLLLSQNYIYGCTMIVNQKLLELARPIPGTAENHDYWISLVALYNDGVIGYIEEPQILYRQHFSNVSGSYTDSAFRNRIKRIFYSTEAISIKKRLNMYKSLYESFSLNVREENRKFLAGYIEHASKGGLSAVFFCIRYRIGRRNIMQTALFYFNLMRIQNI